MVAPNTTITKLFGDLGLTENETHVYLNLLQTPNKTAAELSRIIGMDKSSTYRACERLEKMGLIISSPQTKGVAYIAQQPDILNDLYHQKLKEMEALGSEMDSSILLMKKMATSNARNTQVRIEYGVEALQKAMNESLECKEKLIRERIIGDHHRYFKDRSHLEFVLKHAGIRARKGIYIRQLEKDDSFKNNDYNEIMSKQKKYLKEVRFSPKDWNDTSSLRIWDDTVNIITYDDHNEFLVITIKDKFVANLMKNMYNFIWQRSDSNYVNKP